MKILLPLLFLFGCLSASAQSFTVAEIKDETLLLTKPTAGSPVAWKLSKNTKVHFYRKYEQWFLIEMNDLDGWIKISDAVLKSDSGVEPLDPSIDPLSAVNSAGSLIRAINRADRAAAEKTGSPAFPRPIEEVLEEAGKYFRAGQNSLRDNRRAETSELFNKSIEVFLTSGADLTRHSNAAARNCYDQLIEVIYRLQFPSKEHPPQLPTLAAACGWDF